jgi:hypothetical protein
VRKSDAGLFALYAGDKRVAEATQGIPHPLPPGAAEAFCARAMAVNSEEDIWVMDGTRAALPEVLGVISLKKMDRGQSEVAFWVAPAFWNHGIASEAVQALVAANPQAELHHVRRGISGQSGLGPGSDQRGLPVPWRCRKLFGRARQWTVPTWTYIRRLG